MGVERGEGTRSSVITAIPWKSCSVTEMSVEAAAQRCSVKKVLSEILLNSLENTCVRVSF